MFCRKCGTEIEEGNLFCVVCGTPVDPQTENPALPKAAAESGNPDTTQPSMPGTVTKAITRKRPPILPIVAAVAITAAAGIGIVAATKAVAENREEEQRQNERRELREQLKMAERYLEEMDYEQAVVAYQAAIEIDPKNIDAYLGLAEAYIGLNDYESAIDALQSGADETENDDIQERLEELEELWSVVADLSGVVMIADADNSFANNVPLDGADVHIRRVGCEDEDDTVTDDDGTYYFSDLHLGKYELTIDSDGYVAMTQQITIYEHQEDIYNPMIELVPESLAGEGTASGYIYDALTGSGVGELTLNIRSGYNNTVTDIIETTKTQEDGSYRTPELDAGIYSIEIVDERNTGEQYLDGLINVKVLGDTDISQQNGTVSTELLTDQVRIVLSWGETPSDLDSHLFGALGNNEGFHTYFGSKEAYDMSEESRLLAALDLDDTDSYGPETTTIYSPEGGAYTFVVHDYSSYSARDIATSGAMVQVYMGSASVPSYVFYAPQEDGYYWEVFRYESENGQVVPLNRMMDSVSQSEYGIESLYSGSNGGDSGDDYYVGTYPDWQTAYCSFLDGEYSYMGEDMTAGLLDVNDDGRPELWIRYQYGSRPEDAYYELITFCDGDNNIVMNAPDMMVEEGSGRVYYHGTFETGSWEGVSEIDSYGSCYEVWYGSIDSRVYTSNYQEVNRTQYERDREASFDFTRATDLNDLRGKSYDRIYDEIWSW